MKAVLKRRCADHLHHAHLQDYPPQDHLHHLLRLAQGTSALRLAQGRLGQGTALRLGQGTLAPGGTLAQVGTSGRRADSAKALSLGRGTSALRLAQGTALALMMTMRS